MDLSVEKIYNSYLKHSRTAAGVPFRYKKNFDKFEDTENFQYIKKLQRWFKKHDHIDLEIFFKAPYEIDGITYPLPLKTYTQLSALKSYNKYQKQLAMKEPDSKDQIEFLLRSFKFAINFCRKQDISFQDYINVGGEIPSFVVHIKQNQISLFFALAVGGYKQLRRIFEDEERRLFYLHGADVFKAQLQVDGSKKFKQFYKKALAVACTNTR